MSAGILLIVFLVMCTDLMDTISQTFLKMAVNSLQAQINSIKKALVFVLSLFRLPQLWLSFALSILSLGIWLFVLSKADLNFAYSIDSMRYIFIAFASFLFLKERIGLLRWLGIASVVLGILLVTLS